MRDFEKSVEQGKAVIKKHPNADLNVGEVVTMYNALATNVEETGAISFDVIKSIIEDAFYLGVAVGNRNA